MTRHRSHSIEFKRQVAQEYVAGETLHALAKRHDVSRNLIRIWVASTRPGPSTMTPRLPISSSNTRRRSPPERMVGRQALEIEFLRGALKSAPRPRNATTSVIAGPVVCTSSKDAN